MWSVEQEQVFEKGNNPFDNPFYGYRTLDLLLPDGRRATYFGCIVGDCVHVVALEDDETTYLVRQSRPNVMKVGANEIPETWELPGGFADSDNPLGEITPEELEGSAQAEIEKEIKRHAGTLTHVGPLLPSVGISNELDFIFMGTELSPVSHSSPVEATEQDMRIKRDKFGVLYEKMQRDRLPVSAQTLAAMAKVAFLL